MEALFQTVYSYLFIRPLSLYLIRLYKTNAFGIFNCHLGKRRQGRHFTIDFTCHVRLSISPVLHYRLLGWYFHGS
jgi:hypothetical protein